MQWKEFRKKIPNILTTLRLAIVPIFCTLFLSEAYIAALILFASACITDAIDGYLARHWDAQSTYGKIVDPIADKALVLSSIILASFSNSLMLVPIIIETGIMGINTVGIMKRMNLKKLKGSTTIKKIEHFFNSVKGPTELGRAKTIPLMGTSVLSVINAATNFSLTIPLNIMILSTGVIESATLVQYFNMKILNKESKDIKFIRLGSKDNKEVTEETIIQKENTKIIPVTKTNNSIKNEKEMYIKFQKELKFLEQNSKTLDTKPKTFSLKIDNKTF